MNVKVPIPMYPDARERFARKVNPLPMRSELSVSSDLAAAADEPTSARSLRNVAANETTREKSTTPPRSWSVAMAFNSTAAFAFTSQCRPFPFHYQYTTFASR